MIIFNKKYKGVYTTCEFVISTCYASPKKTTRPRINEQRNERKNSNASAKSKELHLHAQSQLNAAHLLLPQHTDFIVKNLENGTTRLIWQHYTFSKQR